MSALTFMARANDKEIPVSTRDPLPVLVSEQDNPASRDGRMTTVTSSATVVLILPANEARKGASIFNNSTQILYLGLSSQNPTTTLNTLQMTTLTYYELPARYRGPVYGLWAAANGSAAVTEYT